MRYCVAAFGVLKSSFNLEDIMFDADAIREVIVLKAKDLGLRDKELEQLDETVCMMLDIEDPDPLIFPT